MTYVRASYAVRPRQELVRLDSFEILRSPLSDPVDYLRVAALSFYAEVLEEMLPDHDPQDAVFRLLLSVLEQTQTGRIWMPVTYFALWMTRLMGWMPDLARCTVCDAAFRNGPAWWQQQQDGLLCQAHRVLGSSTLGPESLQLADRIFHAPVSSFTAEGWPRGRAVDLRRFAVQNLERHLEGRLSSALVLAKLGG